MERNGLKGLDDRMDW